MSGAQRFTVSAEFETLDEALTLARRLDAEGLRVYVDLGLDDDGDGEGDGCAHCGKAGAGWSSPDGALCGECHNARLRPPCDCDQSGSGFSLCRYCFDEQVGGEA